MSLVYSVKYFLVFSLPVKLAMWLLKTVYYFTCAADIFRMACSDAAGRAAMKAKRRQPWLQSMKS